MLKTLLSVGHALRYGPGGLTRALVAASAGDQARDAGDWPTAAREYTRAVEANPGLSAIWVQLGHALKEMGDLPGGEESYRRALAIDDENADTHLQLGHVLKLQERWKEAAESYLASLERDPDLVHAQVELHSIGYGQDGIAAALRTKSLPYKIDPRAPASAGRGIRVEFSHDSRRLWIRQGAYLGNPRRDRDGPPILIEETIRLPGGTIGIYIDLQSVVSDVRAECLDISFTADGERLAIEQITNEFGPHVGTFRATNHAAGSYVFTLRADLPPDCLIRFAEISVIDDTGVLLSPMLRNIAPEPPLNQINNLIIGTTGVCNASCIHCPTNKLRESAQWTSEMPIGLFNSLLDQILDNGISVEGHISMGLFGDGLLDKHVVERAKRLRGAFPGRPLHVNTNAAAYNSARHAELGSIITLLAVHIETLDAEKYAHLMQPLKLANVLPKIYQIIADMPKIVNITCPTHADNIGELHELRRHFLSKGVSDTHFSKLANRCSRDDVYRQLSLAPASATCDSHVLYDLIVDWDGTVLVCCNDFLRQEPIGNLAQTPLMDILRGAQRRRVFDLLRKGRWDQMKTCQTCKGDCISTVRKMMQAHLAGDREQG